MLAGDRAHLYAAIKSENDKLKDLLSAIPHDLEQEAFFFCQSVKPQMDTLRSFVDKAELVMAAELYPYPTYEDLCYSHHTKQELPTHKLAMHWSIVSAGASWRTSLAASALPCFAARCEDRCAARYACRCAARFVCQTTDYRASERNDG